MSGHNEGQNPVRSLIYEVVDEINEMTAEDRQISKSADTVLIGKESAIDSLGLINLLVTLEDKVTAQYGISLRLSYEIANPDAPFGTLGALIEYVSRKVENSSHA